MNLKDWTIRETSALKKLGLEFDSEGIKKVSEYSYYLPAGLTQASLIELARAQGIKISPYQDTEGEQIPTKRGILTCDLSQMMTPTDKDHRPFNLNPAEQVEWSKAQGGDGLTTAEEALYLLIRAYLEFGRIPFMGGWIRCRNSRGADGSLYIGFFADDGLYVRYGALGSRGWGSGAVAEVFFSLPPLDPSLDLSLVPLTDLKAEIKRRKDE